MGTEDGYTGARKALEREQAGKTICREKGGVAWRLVGEEKGSGGTSVVFNIQEPEGRVMVGAVCDGMPVSSRGEGKGPVQPRPLEMRRIHKPPGISSALP